MLNELDNKFDNWLHKDEANYVKNKIAREEELDRNKRRKRIHETNLEGLESFLDTKMIFGKYRDKYVLDVFLNDVDYLLWLIKKIELVQFKISPNYENTECIKFVLFICESKPKSYLLKQQSAQQKIDSEWESERANRENDLWNEKNPNKNRKSWVDYNNPANYDENMFDSNLF